MNTETIAVRCFREVDIAPLVRILTANGQYDFPEVEGPEAMRRVGLCSAAIFLCAEIDNKVAGCIRATYDGARAIIHLLSVDPQFQKQNIGRTLVRAACTELKHRGAPTVAVTATQDSQSYWEGLDFELLPVFLMLKTGAQ